MRIWLSCARRRPLREKQPKHDPVYQYPLSSPPRASVLNLQFAAGTTIMLPPPMVSPFSLTGDMVQSNARFGAE